MTGDSLELLRKRAKESLARGDYQEARKIYQRAITYRSDNLELHFGMATVCFLLEDLPSAEEHFKEVIRLDPMRANAYINLGAVYDRMGEYEQSLAALNRGIQLDPNRAEGAYNLALVCKHFGDLDNAIEAYREAIRINPRMYEAYYNLGNILFEKNQHAQAMIEYRRALEVRPTCEKAQSALEAAQAGLDNGYEGEPIPVVVQPAPAKPNPIDLDRMIDPEAYGQRLRDLHLVIVEINTSGASMLDFLKHKVEEAIRELSICILATKDPKHNLDDQIQKFDEVMVKLKQHNAVLLKRMSLAKTMTQEFMTA